MRMIHSAHARSSTAIRCERTPSPERAGSRHLRSARSVVRDRCGRSPVQFPRDRARPRREPAGARPGPYPADARPRLGDPRRSVPGRAYRGVANDEQRDFGISFECVGTGSRPARHTGTRYSRSAREAVQPLVSLLNPPAREPARQVRAPMARRLTPILPRMCGQERRRSATRIRRLRSHPAASAISALIFCRARAGPAITARAQVSIIATPKASFQQSRTPVRPRTGHTERWSEAPLHARGRCHEHRPNRPPVDPLPAVGE